MASHAKEDTQNNQNILFIEDIDIDFFDSNEKLTQHNRHERAPAIIYEILSTELRKHKINGVGDVKSSVLFLNDIQIKLINEPEKKSINLSSENELEKYCETRERKESIKLNLPESHKHLSEFGKLNCDKSSTTFNKRRQLFWARG